MKDRQVQNCTDCLNWEPDQPETDYCSEGLRDDVRQWTEATLYPQIDKGEWDEIDCAQCPGFISCDVLIGASIIIDFDESQILGLGPD